jgi:hypothetical protein
LGLNVGASFVHGSAAHSPDQHAAARHSAGLAMSFPVGELTKRGSCVMDVDQFDSGDGVDKNSLDVEGEHRALPPSRPAGAGGRHLPSKSIKSLSITDRILRAAE